MEDRERDPIVAELREFRAQVVAEVGKTPKAISEYVKSKRRAAAKSGRPSPRGKDASPLDEHSEPCRADLRASTKAARKG